VIEHNGNLLPFVHELDRNPFLHPSDNDSSYTDADSEIAWLNPKQPPVQTHNCGSPHSANCRAGKPISNEYFDIFDDEINLWLQFSYQEENLSVHWCVKSNFSRAAMNKLFRNPTMATVRNFTSSHASFKRFNEISYAMGIDSWIPGKVCNCHLAYPNNFRNDDYTRFLYRNRVEPVEFLIQQPALRGSMLYGPANQFIEAEERI